MESVYDELAAKFANNQTLTHRNGPRVDIGLLLFGARDAVRELWVASDLFDRTGTPEARARLHEAVEALMAVFGERPGK